MDESTPAIVVPAEGLSPGMPACGSDSVRGVGCRVICAGTTSLTRVGVAVGCSGVAVGCGVSVSSGVGVLVWRCFSVAVGV